MYAEIALPNAVRQVFTYSVKADMQDDIRVGMRVWIPFGRRKAIGMVVNIHDNKPDFKCKSVSQLLDTEALLTDDLLRITEWVAQYYFTGWGEVLQAALPAGLNYVADRYVSVKNRSVTIAKEFEICDEIQGSGELKLDEAERRWGTSIIRKLINADVLELTETPKLSLKPLTAKGFEWDEDQKNRALNFVANWTGKAYAWINSLPYLMDRTPPISQKELTGEHGLSPFILNRIEKEGFISSVEVSIDRISQTALEYSPERIRALNDEQRKAYEPIKNALHQSVYKSFLLYGITGSGKTEVYIHALKEALANGKGGLVLVPEIALTPQTVRRFYEIFGDQIAVLHSRLNERERYNAWKSLRDGSKKIAIGARSAVFAPVQDLGIIIMDEEHDHSYKQEDPAPRYHAREVALVRASQLGIPIVLGSATPNMNTLHGVNRKKHVMLKLAGRHEEATLPEVKIVDLKQYKGAMRGPLAVSLFTTIEEALGRNEQVILLHNRRGFAAFQQCDACGHVTECPHCSVSLTYHKHNNSLRCHYCGFSRRALTECEKCSEKSLELKGTGTQRIEDELVEQFPNARILRMDRDTTSRKDAHGKILNSFGRGEADILVGTQIVAKGLDFPNVTVVGVVNADTELAFPSYKSSERMFQLLTQVAGRAGRAEKKGVVFLQTRMPNHPSLKFASKHDYEGFANLEMVQRKELNYPPFSRLIQFQFKSGDMQKVSEVAETFTSVVAQLMKDQQVLGPAPSTIYKLYDDFRWESFIKLDLAYGPKSIEQMLSKIFEVYEKVRPAGSTIVRINVNVDV
jgi:primosomal protein N' (replication factor Y)